MGVTKTDFMRGMQCPKMLWLDKHHPEYKMIPLDVQKLLDNGNAFGDKMMGIFGSFVEVQEYKRGTTIPNKPEMVRKTKELIDAGVGIICEAAFMDQDGNYCASDIFKWDDERKCWDLYEVKNSYQVTEQFIKDAGYQAFLIRKCGYNLDRVYIVYHDEEPYNILDVTTKANNCAQWVSENIGHMALIKAQECMPTCSCGIQCVLPYECWYVDYCRSDSKGDNNCKEQSNDV